MKVFIVQAEHPYVPGHVLSVHKTAESADREALNLVNAMLRDTQLPEETGSWKDGLVRLQAALDSQDLEDSEADVWILEEEIRD